uniref:Uncharacterized protein n=1 Tax=Rhizophagus irregularis (strain DAOM 181602 / DAOM 197198 / MUCL 43194) TaxID=747089 RepID=U9T8U6_RHIID
MECIKCKFKCNVIYFQQNFNNWTSGNKYIDKFIQDTQLSAHYDIETALEWIPYDRFCDIKYTAEGKVYRANWIDGYIYEWDIEIQNWKRIDQNIFVTLKSLNDPENISLEFMNISMINRFYGITQDPKTKNYMIVLSGKCKKCNQVCNAIYFQKKFESWTSGNDDIDKFIQDTQLSVHDNHNLFNKAIEWIPYNKFYDIKYIKKIGVYRANWIDGYIYEWDNENQNWKRFAQNMFVILKSLNDPKNISSEFMDIIMVYIFII